MVQTLCSQAFSHNGDPCVTPDKLSQTVLFPDLSHMHRRGLDLSTYDNLKTRSVDVYFQTRPPDANMPPTADRKWSLERWKSFENWMNDKHPFGEPRPAIPQPGTTARVRKDIDSLGDHELAKLTRAFEGLIRRDPNDPTSYFSLAGLHWYPAPFHCKHHEDRYNPWHRAYLIAFEDAMRTVDGCEDVTLPYWDITKPPREFLFTAPFSNYTLPRAIHSLYPAGYTTSRFSASAIAANVQSENIPSIIEHAMSQPVWGNFVSYTSNGIEAAHDSGHGACGVTLSSPDATAFDPLFWFFHSNWDRHWWEWQQIMKATTLWKFRSTITGSTRFLDGPPFNELKPFPQTADAVIDLAAVGISYALPTSRARDVTGPERTLVRESFGSRRVGNGLRVQDRSLASVRLKGINRLAIPGSFRAVLRANGEGIARRTFFQPTAPTECANCRKNSHINLDFTVGITSVIGRDLSVDIELVVADPDIGSRMSLAAVGDPSLNIRLLLSDSA